MPAPSDEPRIPFSRGPGLAVVAGLVILGMGIPAYLMWQVPRLEAERDRIRAEAPTESIGKLELWFQFGQPQIHTALTNARFSASRPWYVSHVRTVPDGPPEIWGIDFSDLDHNEVVRREGLEVRVVLSAPVLMERAELTGIHNEGVPRFGPDQEVDASDLVRRRLEGYFREFSSALGRDIPEARFVVQVGDSTTEEN